MRLLRLLAATCVLIAIAFALLSEDRAALADTGADGGTADGASDAPARDSDAAPSSAPASGGGGADAGTDAAPPARLLQDEAEIERIRQQKTAAVTDAKARLDVANKAFLDTKSLLIDIASSQTTPAEAKKRAASADASADAKTHLDDVRQSFGVLKKSLLALDIDADVTGDTIDAAAVLNRVGAKVQAAQADLRRATDDQATFETDIKKLREQSRSLRDRLHWARAARCKTAYCFGGEGTEFAFEPMLELPIGASIAIGDGALARFDNANELTIQFSAGLRFWFLYDYVSVSIYFAKPIYSGDSQVHVPGATFDHPTTSIRRVGPSFAFGFFGDILFVGGGYDVLRNGSTAGTFDPAYQPNQLLSRAVTFSFGIAPFAAIRNVAGAVGGQ